MLSNITVSFAPHISKAHSTRSIMLGVIIGVSAVITMLAIAQGARQRMMEHIQQMGTNVLTIRSGQMRRAPNPESASRPQVDRGGRVECC